MGTSKVSIFLPWKLSSSLSRILLRLLCFCFRLERMGALEWRKVVHEHQGWRLVTCVWLHAGILHLLTNMLSLIFIGIRLEQQFGFSKLFCLNALSSKLRHFNLWLTCSKSRAYLLNLWSRWKHTLLSFPSRKYLCWCFWCSLWTSWSYVVWTSHQLDYLC